MIQKIQHVLLKFDSVEIRKLEEADSQYAKMINSMKLKNETSKADYSLDPH